MRRARKTHYKEVTVSDDYLEELFRLQDFPAFNEQENVARVRAIIESLPWELQEVFFLYYGERKSIRDIAEILGFNSHWPIQERLRRIRESVEGDL